MGGAASHIAAARTPGVRTAGARCVWINAPEAATQPRRSNA